MDWKIASKKYSGLLEEMATELRSNAETVPHVNTLRALKKKITAIEHGGASFKDDIDRAVDSAPPEPPSREFGFDK